MNANRRLMLVVLTAAVLAVRTPNASAQLLEERIKATFSGPVELPGEVLPAGTYVFEALDNGHLTRILSADEQHVYATLTTVPDERSEPVEKATIVLGENPKGVPKRVEAWFYPGDNVGSDFIYKNTRSSKDVASIMGAFTTESGRIAAKTAKGVAVSLEVVGVGAGHVVVNSGSAIAHALIYLVS